MLHGVLARLVLACAALYASAPSVATPSPAAFGPAGEYLAEARFGDTTLKASLMIVPGDSSLSALFTIPGQPTLKLGTVRVDGRTVTLSDRMAASEISFVIRFDTDDTFTGTWGIGADAGAIAGRRGADPELLPPVPRCADGPGNLPPPTSASVLTPDPDAARLITTDVALFWEVLDAGPAETLAERLHCDYLRRGTDGLRDFIPGRIASGERLAEMITARRDRYEAARQSSLAVAAVEPEIRALFRKMKALYTDAVFPDVYFVIGRFNTGGMISQRGLLIGAEMFTDHSRMRDIVAHELIHYHQRPIPFDQRTLLAQAIMEGSADFVAELISGSHINHAAHEYGLPREQELWKEFSQVMHGSDFSGWLYGKAPEGRPEDLGYFLGYRITEAYYNNGRAEGEALLREILDIADYVDFLDRSGYEPGVP